MNMLTAIQLWELTLAVHECRKNYDFRSLAMVVNSEFFEKIKKYGKWYSILGAEMIMVEIGSFVIPTFIDDRVSKKDKFYMAHQKAILDFIEGKELCDEN